MFARELAEAVVGYVCFGGYCMLRRKMGNAVTTVKNKQMINKAPNAIQRR